MKRMISPSLMCADFMNLGDELKKLEKGNIEYLHVDIMDGVYVPNYTLGTDFVKRLHAATDIPLDIHLMIDEPTAKLDWFELCEGDYVSVHYESCTHIQRALNLIRERGARPMLALNPGTPLTVLEELMPYIDGVLIMTVNPGFSGQKLVTSTLGKITRCRELLDRNGYTEVDIECDGNVSFENAKLMKEAGANIFVAGTSSIYSKADTLENNLARLRAAIG